MSRLNRTSTSFYSKKPSPSKINFQTKFKVRGTNELVTKNLQSNLSNIELPSFKSQENQQNPQTSQFAKYSSDPFRKSCNLISRLNFNHHESQKCLCNECLCGRHMCKLHVVKPDLKKSSIYQKDFIRSKSIKNSRILRKQQLKSLPKVEMNSTYTFSFKDKQPNLVIKHHPSDQLIFEGPPQKITSYKNHFPGNRGGNPYVRPKQLFVSGQFPYKNRISQYKQYFNRFEKGQRSQTGKINDQLRTGTMNCFHQSFYQQKFKSPQKQDYRPIAKIQQKLEVNPKYSHLYESQYDQKYIQIQPAVCPAKIKMETQYKDIFNNTKYNFNQNSDFKAFSTSYQALSMAPRGLF